MIISLPNNTIHIYCIDTNVIDNRTDKVKYLNSEEFQLYNRYINITAKKEFLMGRYLLRTVLGSYLGVDPTEVVLKKNEFGKLYLDDRYHQSNIYFNLSHSHGIVVGAFILDHAIGVDVEKIDGDIDDIVRRFFSTEEQDYINCKYGDTKKALCYQVWTLKEAYIKAKAQGLSISLNTFSVFEDLGVFFYSSRFKSDFYISVAVINPEKKDFKVNLYKLLENALTPRIFVVSVQ